LRRGEFVGEIVRLQVQRVPIKVKTIGYLPDEILSVSRASVDAWGMLGWHEGAWVVDAHNRAHPSRRGGGRRSLSIGFTGHYTAMAERFADAPIGIAGENMIVDGPPLWLSDLREGLIVELADGELLLERPRVAAPCVEFTSFMLGLDEVASVSEIEDALADLHDGRRGFIVAADHASAAIEVTLGSRVYLSR
jgi:MOSC domain-containing protein YiiM